MGTNCSPKHVQVIPRESNEFEIESLELKDGVTGFVSEKVNQELEVKNERESREHSVVGNKDAEPKIEIENNVIGFVYHELDVNNETESREHSVVGNKDAEPKIEIDNNVIGFVSEKVYRELDVNNETESREHSVIRNKYAELENEIKNDVTGFVSEMGNQELEVNNETESRGHSDIGKRYAELVKEICGVNEFEYGEGNSCTYETCSEAFTSKESQQQHECAAPYGRLICMKVSPLESNDFEIESLEIKDNATGFGSEKVNQELDVNNERESREHSVVGNKDAELKIEIESNAIGFVPEKVYQELDVNNEPEYRVYSFVSNKDADLEDEIKSTVIIRCLSEKVVQELDVNNETESREDSVVRNKDAELDIKICDGNELEHVKGNSFKCETCLEVFTSKESQQQHKCVTPYRCLICKKVLTNYADLCDHMLKHENEPCRLCGKTFSDKNYYMNHLRDHSLLKHRCRYCNKLFLSLTNFIIHVRGHKDEKPYACEICGESFMLFQDYKIHLKKGHSCETERPFQCPTCLKKCVSRILLKYHIRIHTGEKPIVCEICGINFGDLVRLRQHMNNLHTNPVKEKKFKCSLCPREYIHNCDLVNHLRTHTGERPFSCHICDKTFTKNPNLISHLNVHTGEKVYDCIVCNRKFSTSSSRNRHIRSHTGETPFVCATCDKGFTLRKDLIRHVRKCKH